MAKSFTNPFSKTLIEYRKLRRDLPRDISYAAAEFFKDSFRKQGFEDRTWIPWKPRKGERGSRRGYTDHRRGKATLVSSGALKRSIRAVPAGGEARVTAGGPKVPYSQIHNEGGMAGRGHKTRIPRRRYMGDSEVFMADQEKRLFKELDRLWSRF